MFRICISQCDAIERKSFRNNLCIISISLILAAAAENISTISSNANGGCNVSVSPNNTTVGISPCGAVPKSIEIEVDVKLKPQKKKARFQNSTESTADANHENPKPQNGEKEVAFSNKNNHEKQSENNEADKQIRPTNETLHNSR